MFSCHMLPQQRMLLGYDTNCGWQARDAVDAIIAARADDIVNVPRAIGHLEAERRAARHAAKQAAASESQNAPGKV